MLESRSKIAPNKSLVLVCVIIGCSRDTEVSQLLEQTAQLGFDIALDFQVLIASRSFDDAANAIRRLRNLSQRLGLNVQGLGIRLGGGEDGNKCSKDTNSAWHDHPRSM